MPSRTGIPEKKREAALKLLPFFYGVRRSQKGSREQENVSHSENLEPSPYSLKRALPDIAHPVLSWPSPDQETLFSHGPAGTPIDMLPGTFAIFFPGDAHNCGISKGGQTQVRKLVGKARF